MINELTHPGKATPFSEPTIESQEITELNEEELEAVHGGFFKFLVIAALAAYAIKKGRANVTLPLSLPTSSSGPSGPSSIVEQADMV